MAHSFNSFYLCYWRVIPFWNDEVDSAIGCSLVFYCTVYTAFITLLRYSRYYTSTIFSFRTWPEVIHIFSLVFYLFSVLTLKHSNSKLKKKEKKKEKEKYMWFISVSVHKIVFHPLSFLCKRWRGCSLIHSIYIKCRPTACLQAPCHSFFW